MPGGVAKNVKKTKQTNPAVNSSHHPAHLSLPVILVDSCPPRNNISSQDESLFDSQTTEIEVSGCLPLLAPSGMTLKHVSVGTSPHCPKQ